MPPCQRRPASALTSPSRGRLALARKPPLTSNVSRQMKRADLLSKLADAIASRSLVRISRKVEPGVADGYVVNTSEQWLLLLLVGDAISYAGFQAFRLQDVASLE